MATIFPNDAPIQSANRVAEDHKDWLSDLVDAFEDVQIALANVWGGNAGVIQYGDDYQDHLEATPTGTPSMTVNVSGGIAVVADMPVYIRSTTALVFTAPVSNARIDIIQVSAATRTVSAKAGTESVTPVAPSPDTDALVLWEVYHRPGETSIKATDDSTNGYLTDKRDWLDAAGGSAGATELDDLSDVDTTGVTDGDVLVYNGSTFRFEPGSVEPTPSDTDEPMVLTAQGLTPAATGGCADPAATETSTNKFPVWGAAFDGGTNEVGWFCNVALPVNYAAGTTLVIRPVWTAGAGTADQTVIWKIAARAFGDDDALDAAFSSNVATITDALIAAGDIHIGPATELTISGTPGPNKLLAFRVERDAITDTLTGDVEFLGLLVTYTGAQ